MKITGVTTHLLSANWAAIDEQWAEVGGGHKSSALVRIETDAGITGIGEIILGYFAPEAVPTLVEYYIPHLIGKDPLKSGALWSRMYESSKWWGRSGAAVSVISGIDIALWDIKGKALGVPVHTLLGGLMHDRMPVYASIGGSPHDLDEAASAVRRWVDQGFRAVKLGQFSNDQFTYDDVEGVYINRPSTAELAEDAAARFRKLREAFGPEVDFIIHNHMGSQAWPLPMNLNEAVRVLQALEPMGLLFAEEPLPYEDIPGYRMLRQRTSTPIAGGEMLAGLHEFQAFLRADALDIVQPDVSFCGGITTTWEVMKLASANFVRTALHMGGSFGPAYAAGLHLSFAHRDAFILETLPVAMPTIRDLLLFPLELVDGTFGPPPSDLPGLGVDLTEEHLRKYPFVPGSGERG
ncbi:MAG TPA: mandelate racemase/muconate lactonizing enzyme family protein [Candidatus Saccharimonadales bacterium]|nr:mandelate racemase/muconate lactonizing enzyme family protein [Candidatus Saccharimonadales bacterium]